MTLEAMRLRRAALDALIQDQEKYLDALRVMRIKLIHRMGEVKDDPC